MQGIGAVSGVSWTPLHAIERVRMTEPGDIDGLAC